MVPIAHWSLIIFLFLIPAAWGMPDEAAGRVVSVVSGDSLGIEMIISDPRTNYIDNIKLADIAAPSTVTAEGKAAKAYAASLLKNKTVYLDIDDNLSQCRNQYSQLICLPGGVGTLDELFEAVTLVQTGKVTKFPIVLIGTAFWSPLADWLRESLAVRGMISPEDMGLVTVVDTVDEAVAVVRAAGVR